MHHSPRVCTRCGYRCPPGAAFARCPRDGVWLVNLGVDEPTPSAEALLEGTARLRKALTPISAAPSWAGPFPGELPGCSRPIRPSG